MVTVRTPSSATLRYWRAAPRRVENQGEVRSWRVPRTMKDDHRCTSRGARGAMPFVRCFAGCAYAEWSQQSMATAERTRDDTAASPLTAPPRRTRQAPLDWYRDYCGAIVRSSARLPIVSARARSPSSSAARQSSHARSADRRPRVGTKGAKTPPIAAPRRLPRVDRPDEGESDCVVLRCAASRVRHTKGAATALTRSQIDARRRRGVGRIVVAFDRTRKAATVLANCLPASCCAGWTSPRSAHLTRPADWRLQGWRAWHLAGGLDLPCLSRRTSSSAVELGGDMPTNLVGSASAPFRSGSRCCRTCEGRQVVLPVRPAGHLTAATGSSGRARSEASV